MTNDEVMTYDQVLKLLSKTIRDLQLDIDLSDYISKESFADIYKRFEEALSKKVDTDTYTAKMIEIDRKLGNIDENIFPIDLSSDEYVSNTLGIEHGGTDATTVSGAQYNLMNDLTIKTTGLDDSDYFLYAKSDQSSKNGSVGKMRASHIWDMVKNKIEDEGVTSGMSAMTKEEIDSIF